MRYYENICNCLRVIQQDINRKLKSANCWQQTSLKVGQILSFAVCRFNLRNNMYFIYRYMAIMYPLRPRMSKRHVLSVIITVWVISVALSLPNLLYGDTVSPVPNRAICILTWSIDKELT